MVNWKDLKGKPESELVRFLVENDCPTSLEQAIRFLAALYYYVVGRKEEAAPISPVGRKSIRVFSAALRVLGGKQLPKQIDEYVAMNEAGDSFRIEPSQISAWQDILRAVLRDSELKTVDVPEAVFRPMDKQARAQRPQGAMHDKIPATHLGPRGGQSAEKSVIVPRRVARDRKRRMAGGTDPERELRERKMCGEVNKAGIQIVHRIWF